ncbi:MAG: hypothetical protein KKA05_10345 [Alphaproteobacteria bacterium]|nr:hypothetical protein [Alphaproteobacteria bacterium]
MDRILPPPGYGADDKSPAGIVRHAFWRYNLRSMLPKSVEEEVVGALDATRPVPFEDIVLPRNRAGARPAPIAEILAVAVRPWVLVSLARRLQSAGAAIPEKGEAEMAGALLFLLGVVERHGEGWVDQVDAEIELLRARLLQKGNKRANKVRVTFDVSRDIILSKVADTVRHKAGPPRYGMTTTEATVYGAPIDQEAADGLAALMPGTCAARVTGPDSADFVWAGRMSDEDQATAHAILTEWAKGRLKEKANG